MEQHAELREEYDDEARLRDQVDQSERIMKVLQRDLRDIDNELVGLIPPK